MSLDSPTLWIMIAITIVIIILGIFVVLQTRKKKRPTDYYSIFLMGLIWTVIGLPLQNWALGGIGLIMLIVGLANRDRWKKNRQAWLKRSRKQRKSVIVITALVAALLALAIFVLLFYGI